MFLVSWCLITFLEDDWLLFRSDYFMCFQFVASVFYQSKKRKENSNNVVLGIPTAEKVILYRTNGDGMFTGKNLITT